MSCAATCLDLMPIDASFGHMNISRAILGKIILLSLDLLHDWLHRICTLSRRRLIVWMVSVCLMKTSDRVDGVCSRGDLPRVD